MLNVLLLMMTLWGLLMQYFGADAGLRLALVRIYMLKGPIP